MTPCFIFQIKFKVSELNEKVIQLEKVLESNKKAFYDLKSQSMNLNKSMSAIIDSMSEDLNKLTKKQGN